ncbi:outer membrane protein [Sulfurimonas xiamenensis]|uniref:Porin family protein n=1 Tax=Sulfurimonas xiamenensis TaxID=2590021 RepID=A0AAJ4DMC0_9BACT|nr:outer membrane beta-barrel protein [Sulfurimonas xiamenensis]QFR43013.1 porin family protein [Sulfurimonas xiamenensis]
MKKIVLAVLLATGLMAADSGMYVGLDVGNTDYNIKASALGISVEESYDDASYTFKAGYYIDANSRVYASYQYIDVEDGDSAFYGVGYDYLIGNGALKPFVGAFVGYGSAEDDEGYVDMSGTVYGGQIGLNYAINENFSAEAGYRYMKSNMDDNIVESDINVNIEIDEIKNWFVGVNYKF